MVKCEMCDRYNAHIYIPENDSVYCQECADKIYYSTESEKEKEDNHDIQSYWGWQ